MDIPPSTGKLTKLAITSYLVYLAREGEVEQIYFFLVQHTAESYPIFRNLEHIAKLPAIIVYLNFYIWFWFSFLLNS